MNANRFLLRTAMLFLGFWILASNFSLSQDQQGTEIQIDEPEKRQVIDSIALFMTEYYVFPEPGKQMADLIMKNYADGKYEDVSEPDELASMLLRAGFVRARYQTLTYGIVALHWEEKPE